MPVQEFDTPAEIVDRLYRQYNDELRSFFRRKSRKQPAEDLAQLVFLRLLNYRGLHEIRDPKLFIYKSAWRVLYTENRRLKYEPLLPINTDPEESKEDLTAHPDLWDTDSIDKAEDVADLERALNRFRPEQQLAFLLYWHHGYNCEEVSARTGINIHTVRKYVYQVMLELRKWYTTNAPRDM